MIQKIRDNVGKVIVGKSQVIELLLTAIISGGHVLLEDLPGTGKTKMAKSMAASINLDFSRIQFTPDLLPTDVTGLNIFDREKNQFVLKKGPVFTNILLADEINRATPRTQAGLLECMEEHQITIDGVTYPLEEPFFVIATQNPIETAGTFILPEAQLDRFLMKISMGTPTYEEELGILDRFMTEDPLKTLTAVSNKEDIIKLREQANKVFVHESIRKYILDIVSTTRKDPKVVIGVSPRGTLALMNAAKAYAIVQGRNYVIPDDIETLAVPVLAHRLVLSYSRQQGSEATKIIDGIIATTKKPTENFESR